MAKKHDYKYVLSIDPGMTCTGIALLQYDDDYVELIDYAYLSEPRNMKGESDCARIFDMARHIVNLCLQIISSHTNVCDWILAIESVYYNRKNPRSLILQSRLLQSIEDMLVLSLGDASDFTIAEYNPNNVKKLVVKGRASKEEIKNSVIDNIKISKTMQDSINNLTNPASESIYDASAVGYAHVLSDVTGDELDD